MFNNWLIQRQQCCCYMTHLEESSGVFGTTLWARILALALIVKYNTLSAALFIQGHLV